MITKSTMVVIFNFQSSNLLTLSLPTEEVFQVNGQNRPVANLPVVDFHSQPREMLTPKPLNTSKEVWTSMSVSNSFFFSVLAAIIWGISNKGLVLRIVKALPFIHQPDRVAPKANDVSAADWLYQHTFFGRARAINLSWKNLIGIVEYGPRTCLVGGVYGLLVDSEKKYYGKMLWLYTLLITLGNGYFKDKDREGQQSP